MWNIPDTVKALYISEYANKYYQITFPNGEMSRKANSTLVQESVEFTESICSEESFHYGLAESSVIQFEMVGGDSIRGMWIDVYLEITIDTLTPAQIDEIRNGNYEGTIQTWADMTNYRIKLGRFIVSKCERTQDPWRRWKVTAYTEDLFTKIQPAEWVKLLCPICTKETEQPHVDDLPAAVYNANVAALCVAQLGYNDKTFIRQFYNSWSSTSLSNQSPVDFGYYVQVKTKSNHTVRLSIKNYVRRRWYYEKGNLINGDILGFEQDAATYDTWKATMREKIALLDLDWGEAKINGTLSVPCYTQDELIDLLAPSQHVYDGVSYGTDGWNLFELYFSFTSHYPGSNETYPQNMYPSYNDTFDTSDTKYFTFYYSGRNDFYAMEVSETSSFTLSINDTTAGTTDTTNFSQGPGTRYIDIYPVPSLPFSDQSVPINPNGQEIFESTYASGYDIHGIMTGWLELLGMFVGPARNGGRRIFRLETTPQADIDSSLYADFFVDERIGKKYGVIRFPHPVADSDPILFDYRFSDGTMIYDMSENKVLQGISMSKADRISYFQNTFINYIKDLELNGLEMNAVGMPWIETGDLLQVSDIDAREFRAYPTRQTIKGIQALRSEMEAVGNDLEL